MYILVGELKNVFTSNPGQDKDGRKYGGLPSVQLVTTQKLKNGEQRMGLLTLTVADRHRYEGHVGDTVAFEVDVYAADGVLRHNVLEELGQWTQ